MEATWKMKLNHVSKFIGAHVELAQQNTRNMVFMSSEWRNDQNREMM